MNASVQTGWRRLEFSAWANFQGCAKAEVVVDTFAEARLHDVEALAEELEIDLQADRRWGIAEIVLFQKPVGRLVGGWVGGWVDQSVA